MLLWGKFFENDLKLLFELRDLEALLMELCSERCVFPSERG